MRMTKYRDQKRRKGKKKRERGEFFLISYQKMQSEPEQLLSDGFTVSSKLMLSMAGLPTSLPIPSVVPPPQSSPSPPPKQGKKRSRRRRLYTPRPTRKKTAELQSPKADNTPLPPIRVVIPQELPLVVSSLAVSSSSSFRKAPARTTESYFKEAPEEEGEEENIPTITDVIVLSADNHRFDLVAPPKTLCKTFQFFEAEERMRILTSQGVSDIPIMCTHIFRLRCSGPLSDGAAQWLRVALDLSSNCAETLPARCGCTVVTSQEVPYLRVARCSCPVNLDPQVVIDTITAFVFAAEFGANEGVLKLLASAFAWHFARLSTLQCTEALDVYFREHNTLLLGVEMAVSQKIITGVYADFLACAVLADVDAAARLSKMYIAFDRHVEVWVSQPPPAVRPAFSHNFMARGICETANARFAVATMILADKTMRLMLPSQRTMQGEEWRKVWAGSLLTGNYVSSDVAGTNTVVKNINVRCCDYESVCRIVTACKTGTVQRTAECSSSHYSFQLNEDIKMFIMRTPSSVPPLQHPSSSSSPALSDEKSASITVCEIVPTPVAQSAISPELKLLECLYDTVPTSRRFAYSPYTGALYASLQAIAALFYNAPSLKLDTREKTSIGTHEQAGFNPDEQPRPGVIRECFALSATTSGSVSAIADFEYLKEVSLAYAVSTASIRALGKPTKSYCIVGNNIDI
jgi:hypothetical protein